MPPGCGKKWKIPHGAPMLPPYKFRVVEGNCWIWLGATIKNGRGRLYGVCHKLGKRWLIHRLMYHLHVEHLLDGYEVHHVCGESMCGNPAHLQALKASKHRRYSNRRSQEET